MGSRGSCNKAMKRFIAAKAGDVTGMAKLGAIAYCSCACRSLSGIVRKIIIVPVRGGKVMKTEVLL